VNTDTDAPNLSKDDIKALAEYIELLIEIDSDLKKRGINIDEDNTTDVMI